MSMVVAAALLAGGCGAPQVGRPLGYVIDTDWSVLRGLGTFWTTAADQADLVRALEGLAAEDLAQHVAGLDLRAELIITIVYDGCTHDDPSLALDGSELSVRFGTTYTRNCVRPINNLALFALGRAELPDPVTFRVSETCGITLRQGEISTDC